MTHLKQYFAETPPLGAYPVGTKARVHTLDGDEWKVVNTYVTRPVAFVTTETSVSSYNHLSFHVAWLSEWGQSGSLVEIAVEGGWVIAGIICGRTGLFTKSSVVSVVPRTWLEEMLAKVETYVPTF
jgi:hypothetical protein